MKKGIKEIIGVTLLEVMLVLAIASMIIVMSIRYYQSTTAAQQANAVLAQVMAIVSAADGMMKNTGSFATAASGCPVDNSTLTPLLPANAFMSPWGGNITASSNVFAPYSLVINLYDIPLSVCTIVRAKLGTNVAFNGSSLPTTTTPLMACPSSGAWTIYYVPARVGS